MQFSKIKYWQWIVFSILLTAGIYFIIPPDSPYLERAYSKVVLSKEGEFLHVFINPGQQWHLPPDSSAVPEKLAQSVIHFEDKNFHSHIGIDFRSIGRAIIQNFKAGKVVSGASTLPMQLVRIKHQNKRSFFNKLLESFEALKISLYFSKEEILKLYLQHAPYGGNVIGYQTAAHKFFGKKIQSLSWAEAATLAVLPNAPGLVYPSTDGEQLLAKRNRLLKSLHEAGYLSSSLYEVSLLEQIPDQFIPFYSQAPHVATFVKNKYSEKDIIATTLSAKAQTEVNQIADKYRSQHQALGINGLAILVADTKSGEIKAYIGSPDFYNNELHGQVDAVLANRSSGSILKPFLYALSIDEGLILPSTFIKDLPTYYDGFSPNNASEEFSGVVTAKFALTHSLNIPAVRLLNAYGLFQFYSFLKEAGVSSLFRSADEYGLPLILGGAEVSLWDMIKLYRGLANEGKFTDNKILLHEKESAATSQLVSSASSHITLNMIKHLNRPGNEYYWRNFSNQNAFAWKTGTSYGHKDAWAIGLNPKYTIGVWVGNYDGQSNKNISGAHTAGPVLFDVLHALMDQQENEWFEKIEMDYKTLKVCKLSGFRASASCEEIINTDVPYGMKSMQSCPYHQTIRVSDNEQFQTCSACWAKLGANEKNIVNYPPDIAYYLRLQGQLIAKSPAHYPKCPRFKNGNSTQIIYPNQAAKLFLPTDFNGELQQVICKAGYTETVEKIYWYLNETYLGETTHQHKMAAAFEPGWNTLKIIDNLGGEDTRKIFAVVKK